MNKKSIILSIFLLMTLFVGLASATTSSNSSNQSLTQVICGAWYSTIVVPGYETLIEGAVILVSFIIIGYEAFQRTHMKHLSIAQGSVDENELATVMSHSMSIIIVMGIILIAVIASFTVVNTIICKGVKL